jgi:hypothetical protein
MASASSGILAYGLMQLKGRAGLDGWNWIFIVSLYKKLYLHLLSIQILTPDIFQFEGLITCIAGIIGYFFIVDFPELSSKTSWSVPFLNERESAFIVARIEKDRADVIPEPFHLTRYLRNALDLKVWGFAWLFGLTTTNSYAIAYFLPIM